MSVRIDERYCKGCGICVFMCPKKVLEESEALNKKGFAVPKVAHPENCINCHICEQHCPEFAIDVLDEKKAAPSPSAAQKPQAAPKVPTSTREMKTLAPRTILLQGDEAIAEGAIAAGCKFYGGYPITPATEIAEGMSRLLPLNGGKFIQTEDEISAIGAAIGASWAGAKSMTATSGPGFSLMQENIGYAVMTETPCVIVDVQRSGPSTGQATKPAQGDAMQARFGSHGDYEIIALSPSSVQECFDLTIRAFNLSEKYRVPVIILADGEIGHLRESVRIPKKIEILNRRMPEQGISNFFGKPEQGTAAPMPAFGTGHFVHVTGSTHKEDGMRDVTTKEVHERMVKWFCDKINENKDDLVQFEEKFIEDAEILVISYGATARPALGAVQDARKSGMKVGFFRPVTIWPSPEKRLREILAKGKIKKIIVSEMALRGYFPEIERIVAGKCELVHNSKIGGEIHTKDEILTAIKEANK
ncbi:MAG: 2-oxoacid:acceptor oxidoreductase subunit alpha [Candidatus Thermoplasmatota archaeon]|nr:2-oxoacid:acceptor oxidoreductase subunit alpha [Candidatus Thermoplasmatota archaeon]